MSGGVEKSGSGINHEDQIEKDAEKAYRNMSMEARVVGNLVSGVDDEDFEHVWEEKASHSSNISSKSSSVEQPTAFPFVTSKDDLGKDSSSSAVNPVIAQPTSHGVLSPSSLAGFQTVPLKTLPGSRLQITRETSVTSSERSNSSCEADPASSTVARPDQDSAVMAAIHMKPRGLAGSGKPNIPNMGSHVNPLEQAQAEWKLVENLQKGEGEARTRSPEVTFLEALDHFRNSDCLEQYMSHIKPTVRYRGCKALTHSLFGPPNMKRHLHNERNLVFALALCMFDNDEAMHSHVLQTIYKRLAGTKLDCPRYGNHWEVIGFQGIDPSTDLRGCGFLGLLNILYIVTDTQAHVLAANIFKLSQHETQNFPFSIMSINITRIALQSLREGKLNRECNSRGKVFEVFNQFYAAVFYRVYTVWKSQRKTISDSGFVLREVEKYSKSHTRDVLRELSRAVFEKKPSVIAEESANSPRHGLEKLENFSGVCDIQENEQEEVHLV